MKKQFKNLFAFLLALTLVITAVPANVVFADTTVAMEGQQEVDANDIVILYTNDVHNAYDHAVKTDKETKEILGVSCIGYSSVAWFKKDVETTTDSVTLIDNGDAIQGGVIGVLSKGEDLVDIMNYVGYEIAVPGNHEFDFGMDQFRNKIVKKANYQYVASNFIDLKTNKSVFKGYTVKDYTVDGKTVKVAFVGVATPESYTKSTPKYFQDEKGNYIYSFCEDKTGDKIAKTVQASVDAAKKDGKADYVVVMSHLGVDPSSAPFTSEVLISKTTGIDVVLDGHSHTVIDSQTVKNKAGKDVTLSSTGTKLNYLGELVIDNSEKTIKTSLVKNILEEDAATKEYVATFTAKVNEKTGKVVAKSEVDLVVNDPKTENRIIRNQETNLGDLCADAYRDQFGADVAIVNGGGIRANIAAGDLKLSDIIAVHPFGNMGCLAEVTGQQIADALELGSRGTMGEEIGGFLQVSGMSYVIDTDVESTVELDDKGNFIKVAGARRVKNILIGGKPIDLKKTYKLATHNYALKQGGDGYTMFKGCKILIDETIIDNEVLSNYIQKTLKGVIKKNSIYANTYGEGRISVITKKNDAEGATTKCCYKYEGFELKAVGHNYIEKVTKKPTLKKTGKMTYTCKYCGHKKTKTLAKLKKQTIKLSSKATVTYKASTLKKSAKSTTIKVKNAKTDLVYEVVGKTAKKYITVSTKGKVTIKKKTPKGTYKVTVYAKGSLKYAKSAKKTIVIKVK